MRSKIMAAFMALMGVFALLGAYLKAAKDVIVSAAKADDGQFKAFKQDKDAQVGTVITVVTIGIVAIIGILIYSQVDQSLPAPDNSDLNNSSDSVTEGFGSAMQLVPIVLIVLVASLVIAVVQRFGG